MHTVVISADKKRVSKWFKSTNQIKVVHEKQCTSETAAMQTNSLGVKHRKVFGLSLLTALFLPSFVLDIKKSGAEAGAVPPPPEIGIRSFGEGQTSAELGRGKYTNYAHFLALTHPMQSTFLPLKSQIESRILEQTKTYRS